MASSAAVATSAVHCCITAFAVSNCVIYIKISVAQIVSFWAL